MKEKAISLHNHFLEVCCIMVWKLDDLYLTWILREINIDDSKDSKIAVLIILHNILGQYSTTYKRIETDMYNCQNVTSNIKSIWKLYFIFLTSLAFFAKKGHAIAQSYSGSYVLSYRQSLANEASILILESGWKNEVQPKQKLNV